MFRGLEEKPMKKKIAIVLNNSWAAYNFRFNLARGLKKGGYDVIFIVPYNIKYSELIHIKNAVMILM